MKSKQTGFTLIEVIAALVIAGMFATYALQQMQSKAIDGTVDNAARKVIMVGDAAKRFRLATGVWPSNVAQLVDNNYLTAAQATSAFNTPYTFSVSGTGLNERLIITNQATDNRYARRMEGILPEGTSSGNVYSFLIPPPGLEASLSALYALDGSRALTGAMNANNNDINNVRTLGATTVNATNITATGTVRGGRVYSTGNVDADVNLTAGQNIHAGRDLFVGQHAVVNGYAEIKGDVYARNNLTVTNTAQAGTIKSLGTITANGNIHSNSGVTATSDISAGRYLYGQRMYDSNNPARYVDPASRSELHDVSINGGLFMQQKVIKDTTCSGRQVGMDNNGNILTCVGGRWTLAESSQLKYKHFYKVLVSSYATSHELASSSARSADIPLTILNDDPVSLDIELMCWNGGGPHFSMGVGTNASLLRRSLHIHEHGHVQGARLTIPVEPGASKIWYKNIAYSANQKNFHCNGTNGEPTFWLSIYGYNTYN